jgi:hypothetical protein
MESHDGTILTRDTEELRENPVSVSLFSIKIPHGLFRVRTRGFRDERPVTNRLSHGMALLSTLTILGMN